jgi:hypothetical protein
LLAKRPQQAQIMGQQCRRAVVGSLIQLRQHYRTQLDVRRAGLLYPLNQDRGGLLQVGNPGVGVQEVDHGQSFRLS